jgi:hypothetical protein
MAAEGSDHSEQGRWMSRSTNYLVSYGWTQGITRGRSWTGTVPLPPDWYFESLIQDVRDELQRLRDEGKFTHEELRARALKLTEVVDRAFSA